MCIRDSTNPDIPKIFKADPKDKADLRNDIRLVFIQYLKGCLLYTSDAADERSSVDLGGRRIIKKKKKYHP